MLHAKKLEIKKILFPKFIVLIHMYYNEELNGWRINAFTITFFNKNFRKGFYYKVYILNLRFKVIETPRPRVW